MINLAHLLHVGLVLGLLVLFPAHSLLMSCNVVNRSGNLNNPNIEIHFKTTSYYVSIHSLGQLIFRDLAVLLSSASCSCLSTFRLSILLDKLCCNQGCFRT
jgi:hypothetical protein